MTPPATRADAGQLAPGTIFTLLAATGFAAVSILTSLATATGISLANVLAWRYVLSAVVLVGWVGTHDYKRIPPREMLGFVGIGGFGQALMVYIALSSLKYIPVQTLAFVFYTYPAWVTLFQAVRGAERIDRRRAIALGLSFLGLGIMLWPSGTQSVDWRGVALALTAALIYGVFIPVMRILQKDHPVAPPSAYAKIGAALFFLVLSVSDKSFTYSMNASAWSAIIALTLFSTVLPSVFFLMGLIRLGPVRTAIVSTVEPFLTALLGALVLRQQLSIPTLIGGVLIVAAVVLLQFRRDRVA